GHVELGLVPDGGGRLLAQRVGRQREEDRTAGRRRRELHAAAHGFWNRGGRLRRPVPFGDGLGHDLAMVAFLEQVAPERVLLSTEATATRIGIWSFQLLTICVMALGRPILATMTTPVLPEARA